MSAVERGQMVGYDAVLQGGGEGTQEENKKQTRGSGLIEDPKPP